MFVYRPTSAFVCQRLTAPLAAGWDLPPDPPEPPLHPLKGENILALHKFLTRFQTADKSQLFSAPTARRPARQRSTLQPGRVLVPIISRRTGKWPFLALASFCETPTTQVSERRSTPKMDSQQLVHTVRDARVSINQSAGGAV